MARPWKNLTGMRFGKWTVVEHQGMVGSEKRKHRRYLCRCDCGNTASVLAGSLLSGTSTQCLSCGMSQNATKHGGASQNASEFGDHRTTTYRSWRSMLNRCTNPNTDNYRYYGARGIAVCDRWRHYESFLADMGDRPGVEWQIDRIDPAGNYTPENCRWRHGSENSWDRSNTIWVTAFGKTKRISEWASEFGLNRATIDRRLRYGWDPETAVSQPSKRSKKCA